MFFHHKSGGAFHPSSSTFHLSVTNTSVEIPDQEHERILDKFYRIPSSDRWQQGGTGLGLALVKQVVKNLGGSIQVKSANHQTCFTVQLPNHTIYSDIKD